MGQYYLIINKTKKQYLNPHRFGDGLKLLEFGPSGRGTMYALALLLRQSDEGGGGDYPGENPVVGSWAGDEIAIVGDYDSSRLFQTADEEYEEMSAKVWPAMLEDSWARDEMKASFAAQREQYGTILFFDGETVKLIEQIIGDEDASTKKEIARQAYNRKRRAARAAKKAEAQV